MSGPLSICCVLCIYGAGAHGACDSDCIASLNTNCIVCSCMFFCFNALCWKWCGSHDDNILLTYFGWAHRPWLSTSLRVAVTMLSASAPINAVMRPLLEFLVSLELARWRFFAYVWTSEQELCSLHMVSGLVEWGIIASQVLIPIAWFVVACCIVSMPFAESGVAAMTVPSYLPTLAELTDHDCLLASELS